MYWQIRIQSSAGLILAAVTCEMPAMASRSLQRHLQENFQPAAAGAIDATFRLAMAGQKLTFHIAHGTLEFVEQEHSDATFYFDDEDSALALLSGQSDPFDAFMNGQFRADGYLVWAFVLLGMFRGGSSAAAAKKKDAAS